MSEYQAAIEQALVQQDLARDPIWTEGIAVGSRTFIEKATGKVRNRVRIEQVEVAPGIWTVREPQPTYTPVPGSKTAPRSSV